MRRLYIVPIILLFTVSVLYTVIIRYNYIELPLVRLYITLLPNDQYASCEMPDQTDPNLNYKADPPPKYKNFMDTKQNYSSVWCTGAGDTKTCLFTNVCYDPGYSGWIFYEENSPFFNLPIKAGAFNVPEKIYTISRGDMSDIEKNEKFAKFKKLQEPIPQNSTFTENIGLLFAPFVPYNPGHAYVDDMMPLYWLMHIWQDVTPDNHVLLWSHWSMCDYIRKKQLEKELLVLSMYSSLSKNPLVCLKEDITTPWCFRKLSVGTFGLGMGSPSLRLASPIFRDMRDFLALNFNLTNQPFDLVPEIVWVSHKSARRLLNEDDIIQKLIETYKVNIHKVQWEDYTFYERFKVLSKAVIRVGFFGTSSITHLYMRTGTINLVICSRTCGNEIGWLYEPGIAHVRSLYWRPSNDSLIFADKINYPNETGMAEQQADIIIDFDDFIPTWEAALTMAKYLIQSQ